MKLPRKLNIGGLTYTVLFPYEFEDDENLIGLHDYTTTTIKVSNKQKGKLIHPQKIYETFLHEILHAIDCIYCTNVLDDPEVDIFASGLYFVLSNNDLYLNSNKMADEINVNGFKYVVDFPCKFDDGGNHAAIIKTYEQKMCISGYEDNGTGFSNDCIKRYLIMLLITAICEAYALPIDSVGTRKNPDFRIEGIQITDILGGGIYQVLKENKLNELMMKNG